MNILIVDDSKINQIIAKETLQNNYIKGEFFVAADGIEAIELLTNHKFELVLLDIVMPNMSGIQVLEKLEELKLEYTPKIIMLTTIEDNLILQKCFSLGATDYIKKPFNDLEFVSRVKSVIREVENEAKLLHAAKYMEQQNLELIKANKSLKEAQYYLVQKEKMVAIGELAAGIAHEINNPLAFVMSNLETAQEYVNTIDSYFFEANDILKSLECSELDEKMKLLWREKDLDFIKDDFKEVLSDSQSGLHRVAKIVKTMRDFARISDEDVFEYVDVNVLVDEALLIVNNEIKYTSEIRKQYSECKLIYCNKGQIEQVLVNMLVNASQAIKQKNVENGHAGVIKIETKCEDKYVLITIEDNGIGIKEDEISKVFNPFFTTKPVGQGTGLGLSISHDIIVNKHRGEILIDSEYLKGTLISVKLPLRIITES